MTPTERGSASERETLKIESCRKSASSNWEVQPSAAERGMEAPPKSVLGLRIYPNMSNRASCSIQNNLNFLKGLLSQLDIQTLLEVIPQ